MAKISKEDAELLKAVQRQANRLQQAEAEQARGTEQSVGAEQTKDAELTTDAEQDFSSQDIKADLIAGGDASNSTPDIDHSTVGVGVDLLEIDRMEHAIERRPRILMRVFSSGEREYAWSKARPAAHYAAFFAAREAVLKALGQGFAGIAYQDVEVIHDSNGKPGILLRGNALALAQKQGIIEIQISLSHTHQMAVASAVAIKAQSSPQKNVFLSPMEELAIRFKELRSLLDDLGMSAIIETEAEPTTETATQSDAEPAPYPATQAEAESATQAAPETEAESVTQTDETDE